MTSRQRATLAAAILGSAIVFLDGTIVSIALPRIGRELPGTIVGTLEGRDIHLVRLSRDARGVPRPGRSAGRLLRSTPAIFLIGLVGFGITSVLCGLAPYMELLALGRLLQGIAGAILVPGSLSIITTTFDGPARARAFGLWAASTSALSMFGPPIGGVLVEVAGWRWRFLINVPVVILAIWLGRYMAESRATATGRSTGRGAVAAVAIGGLAFGATRGHENQWTDRVAFIALGLGCRAIVLSDPDGPQPIRWSRSACSGSGPFSTINLSTLLIYGACTRTPALSAVPAGTARVQPPRRGLIGLPAGILLTFLSARVGAVAGASGSAASSSPGRS